MKALRGMRPSATDKNLTSTANDLAAALKVTMEFDGLDLLEGGGDIWLEPGVTCPKVVKTRRAIDMNNEKNWQEVRSRFFITNLPGAAANFAQRSSEKLSEELFCVSLSKTASLEDLIKVAPIKKIMLRDCLAMKVPEIELKNEIEYHKLNSFFIHIEGATHPYIHAN